METDTSTRRISREPDPTTPATPAETPTADTPPWAAEILDQLAALRKQAAKPAPQMFAQDDAISYVGVSRTTWFRLRSTGDIPDPVNIEGSGQRWRKIDLDRYLDGLKPRRTRKARRK